MLYRPYSGYGQTDTEIAKDLHNLAYMIANAKKTGDAARVKSLYDLFVAKADDYRSTGGTEASILNLINSVHDTVLSTVQEIATTVGTTAANLTTPLLTGPLGKLIVPIGLIAAVVILAPMLMRRKAA